MELIYGYSDEIEYLNQDFTNQNDSEILDWVFGKIKDFGIYKEEISIDDEINKFFTIHLKGELDAIILKDIISVGFEFICINDSEKEEYTYKLEFRYK